MTYDNICKYLSEKYPEKFATWLLEEPIASVEVLKSELSIEPVEFQVEVTTEPPLPLRMLDYWVRLYRRYRLPITQVLVLLRPTTVALSEQF